MQKLEESEPEFVRELVSERRVSSSSAQLGTETGSGLSRAMGKQEVLSRETGLHSKLGESPRGSTLLKQRSPGSCSPKTEMQDGICSVYKQRKALTSSRVGMLVSPRSQ